MTGVVLYPINEEAISGSYLVAEIELTEATLEWCMGIWDLSDWRLQLDLEPATIDAVLDLFAQRGPRLCDIVTAARDPESPAGLARRAAVEQWEQHDPD